MSKPSAGRVQDAWAEIDRMLEKNQYLRFSVDCARKRWHAVLFWETGGVLSRAYGDSREEALVKVVKGIPREE